MTAKDFDAAAGRAFTLADVDAREHDAAQVRLLAGAVASGDAGLSVADAWLHTCGRILDRYERADMDRIHAERASRRGYVRRINAGADR
ncbi:hypothetical protein [Leifsonia aquatica]|uniref:hypothetical protein n=1 Tax=Leifsonia aquatica TaxID=144185 RepID=UPI00381D00AD